MKKAGTTQDSMVIDTQNADNSGGQEMVPDDDEDDDADMEEIFDTPS